MSDTPPLKRSFVCPPLKKKEPTKTTKLEDYRALKQALQLLNKLIWTKKECSIQTKWLYTALCSKLNKIGKELKYKTIYDDKPLWMDTYLLLNFQDSSLLKFNLDICKELQLDQLRSNRKSRIVHDTLYQWCLFNKIPNFIN